MLQAGLQVSATPIRIIDMNICITLTTNHNFYALGHHKKNYTRWGCITLPKEFNGFQINITWTI